MRIDLSNENLMLHETLYFTGNGYIGIRANFEEGYPSDYDSIRGSYINGYYESYPITYGESAVGFPKVGEKMVNLMDGQGIRIKIGGDQFSMFDGQINAFDRGLDIEKGYAYRIIDWTSPSGHRMKIEFRRLTSFVVKEVAVISVIFTSINYDGVVEVLSSVEGEVTNYASEDDPRVADDHGMLMDIQQNEILGGTVIFKASTKRSNIEVGLCALHEPRMHQMMVGGHRSEGITDFNITKGESKRVDKYLVFTDSIRHTDVTNDGLAILSKVVDQGARDLYDQQSLYLEEFWSRSKVEILGNQAVEEAVNYSVYQLLASAGTSKQSQISAKGLSGEGYEGHYFWDTEIYMIPFFTLTNPELAKNLLSYRYDTLDAAKARAREMGHALGAKIPWRTISGIESSAYFPAGSAQYHINADVAYAMIQYYIVTKDLSFMIQKAFEVIYETARIWLDMGHFDEEGRFRIHSVTGPDEYTAIVNNNYYTNAMAQYHMKWAMKLLNTISDYDFEAFKTLESKIGIKAREMDMLLRAADKMYLPFDKKKRISVQDDGFMEKKPWDFESEDEKKRPLLLHFHPLTIYRHQVLKQADTVLAHFLLDNEDDEIMKRSYHFYEKLTTHDSSLSPCVYSMMAARIGEGQKAYDYFMKTVRLDLDNLHHNTKDGLHIANAGGAYMGIVYGFAGLRITEDGIVIRPLLPKKWQSITFSYFYQGIKVKVTVGKKIKIVTSGPISLCVYNRWYEVDGERTVTYNESN